MGQVDLSHRRVRAIEAGDRIKGTYFVFVDGALLRTDSGGVLAETIAEVSNIRDVAGGIGDGRLEGKDVEIRLHVQGSWVCVSERFGVNAALVNIDSGAVRALSRKDYHSDVSSYSIGLLQRDGRTLLIAQTEWNRLDIFDAETGENLTEREVWMRDTGTKSERGDPIYEHKNYLDYFHSQLHISPDSRQFLSNGWVWSPVDMVLAFATETFLTGWEPTGARFRGSGYNWDRPATFVGNDMFVLALDDASLMGDFIDEDELATYADRHLAFITIPDLPLPEGESPWLKPTSLVSCDVFRRNAHGEVKGELHHDPVSGCLVALTESDGAFLVSLTGQILDRLPQISLGTAPAHTDFGSRYSDNLGWAYSPRRRLFYRWRAALGVEEHRFLTTG